MSKNFVVTVPKITGSISAVSSSLIIYLIHRSKPKLSTIYHRIMFCMSVADILASTAIALTTLPMPRDDDPYWEDVDLSIEDNNSWSGQTKLGTRQTCAAQGFFYSTGINIMLSYNGSLGLYYVCAIAFRMKEAQIRKKIEPFMHGGPLLVGLIPAITNIMDGIYNPSPQDPWCTPYPPYTTPEARTSVRRATFVSISVLFVMNLIYFSLIIWRVVQNGRQLAQADSRGDIQIDERFKAAHRNTRLIILQSLAYTGALFLTLIFLFARNVLLETTSIGDPITIWMSNLASIFLPLQGFFNFNIFLWHKVENYRRANPAIGFFHIVRLLFTTSAEEPVLLSRLSMLKVDEEDKRLEAEVYDELELDEEVELDSRLEMYDDLGEPVSRQSGGGLSGGDNIAGPASIGEAVITYPDVRSAENFAENLVHYRGLKFKFRGQRKGEQGAQNISLDRHDDLREPASSLQSDGGLSIRMSTIGEHSVIDDLGAPMPIRRTGELGAENESFENDGDLSMGSRDQSNMSRSIFSLSLFSGDRSRENASRSLGGGSGLSNDEP